jgi:hypothetical protein
MRNHWLIKAEEKNDACTFEDYMRGLGLVPLNDDDSIVLVKAYQRIVELTH